MESNSLITKVQNSYQTQIGCRRNVTKCLQAEAIENSHRTFQCCQVFVCKLYSIFPFSIPIRNISLLTLLILGSRQGLYPLIVLIRVAEFIYLGTLISKDKGVEKETQRSILAGNRTYFYRYKFLHEQTSIQRY